MIWLLLPAYNEESSLPKLLPKVRQAFESEGLDYRLIACDDGSRDRTRALLEQYSREMPIEVVTHKYNRGLGESSRDLFERAAERAAPQDVLVRMDCDDTHEPRFILSLVRKLEEGYDVVTASRFLPGGGQIGVSRYRAFVSRGANLFMRLFFHVKGLREYSCGYRAYRAEIIQRAIEFYGNRFISLQGLGFTCTLEKLVKLKLIGARFAEVPFVLRYDQKSSQSKMISSITMLGYMVMAVCYHWPWGGWRNWYPPLWKEHLARSQGSGWAAVPDDERVVDRREAA